VAFDPDYAKVSLLLHGDGADGSTVFTDNAPTPKAVTASGSAAISTAQSKFGGASLGLTGGFLSVADSADLDTSTGDFTIEFWLRPASLAANAILFNKASGTSAGYPYQGYVSAAGGVVFRAYNASSQELFTLTTAGGLVAVGAWTHLAFVRSGSTFAVYVNGVSAGSATYAGSLPVNTQPMSIGAYSNGSYPFSGHIDDFRFTKGVARYTANFTPPTEAFPDTASAPALSAYAAAPTPLGTPATLAASIRQAWVSAASPLGAPAILAASGESFFARSAAATPLGTPIALARAVGAARVATAGPLGAGAALGQLVAVARAMAVGPLGAPVVMARTTVYAQASAPSPLGDPVVKANLPSVLLQAQGFNSTAFGTPSFATRLQAAGFNSTAFGVPSSPVPQTVVASGFSKTSFGWPFGFQYIQPKINQVVSASPLATTQFGLPSAFIDVTVQAAGSTSGQFGTPTTKLGLGAQAIAPATSWGAPLLLLSMRAQGFGGTSFGVPHAVMVQHAASTYRATRWGLPTCTRSNTYLARSIASTSRFGRPTARKINAYQASSITSTGQFGTPACALRYRALGIHGVARFGKPLLIRSAAC
jgi:hypothetical protein